jgi:hypothetical protein
MATSFVAKHVSYDVEDYGPGEEVGIFALADEVDNPEPKYGVIIQCSEYEDDQDKELGQTGLHVETTWHEYLGYGCIKSIQFDGTILSIVGDKDFEGVEAEIQTSMMDNDRIFELVSFLNDKNSSRPK